MLAATRLSSDRYVTLIVVEVRFFLRHSVYFAYSEACSLNVNENSRVPVELRNLKVVHKFTVIIAVK